jgi:hypothetical protein
VVLEYIQPLVQGSAGTPSTANLGATDEYDHYPRTFQMHVPVIASLLKSYGNGPFQGRTELNQNRRKWLSAFSRTLCFVSRSDIRIVSLGQKRSVLALDGEENDNTTEKDEGTRNNIDGF